MKVKKINSVNFSEDTIVNDYLLRAGVTEDSVLWKIEKMERKIGISPIGKFAIKERNQSINFRHKHKVLQAENSIVYIPSGNKEIEIYSIVGYIRSCSPSNMRNLIEAFINFTE